MKRRESAGNMPPVPKEDGLIRAAREYVRASYSNPERKGCPGRRRLEALARDECRPADDVVELEHVVTCSPCFEEYEEIRTAWRRKRTATFAGVAAAALLVIVGVGLVFLSHRNGAISVPASAKPVEIARGEVQKQLLDLRPFETFRGAPPIGSQPLPAPPILGRANLLLTVQLPVGSYEGRYFFTIADSEGRQLLQTSATAEMKDHVTTAELQLDLRGLRPGQFTLLVRRDGAYATTPYSIQVR